MCRMHSIFRVTLLLGILGGLAVAFAEENNVLYVEAGSTRARTVDGNVTKWLSNGLKAWHKDAELTAEEGILYSDPMHIVIHGNAVFKDSTRTIESDTLIYYEDPREAFAIGHVVVKGPGRRLTSAHLHYEPTRNLVTASGGVAVIDDSLNASMDGLSAVFNDSTRYGLIIGKPVLRRVSEDGSVMTITCSDTIEAVRSEDIVRLWNNVEVTRDSLKAYADYAVYHDDTEEVVLTGSPELVYLSVHEREGEHITLTTTSIVRGDSIRIQLADRAFAGAVLAGSVSGEITAVDSAGALYDRTVVECQTMRVEVDGDEITLISAEGTAESYYHRRAVDSARMFVNVANGDTLNFYFSEGRMDNLRIFGSGGGLGRGKYYSYDPMNEAAQQDSLVSENGE